MYSEDLEKYVQEIDESSQFKTNKEIKVSMKPYGQGERKKFTFTNVDKIKIEIDTADTNNSNIKLLDYNDMEIGTIYPDQSTIINNIPANEYNCYGDNGSIDGANEDNPNQGCYLTTACVDYFGKPDDCYELETLRSFRDGFMQTSTEMKEAAKKYYVIAPKIVAKINSLPNKASVYQKMYTDLVQKCINLINKGKNKEAYETYKDYSEALEEKYL